MTSKWIRNRISFSLLLLPLAWGQSSPVVCEADRDWVLNSREHTPCLVASYLQRTCGVTNYNVAPLDFGQLYSSPTPSDASECRCSSVFFSLLQGCAWCQNRATTAWSNWITNCSTDLVTIGRFPNDIPEGTRVPSWAYLDVSSNDQFDPVAAQAVQDAPESSGAAPSSTAPPSSETSSPTDFNNFSKPKMNIGLIVGASIGGAIGLALIAFFVFYLRQVDKRGKSKKVPPSAEFSKGQSSGNMSEVDPAAVGFRSASRHNTPLNNNGLDGGNRSPTGGNGTAFVHGYGGSPWSPPPPAVTPFRTQSPYDPSSNSSAHMYGSPPGSPPPVHLAYGSPLVQDGSNSSHLAPHHQSSMGSISSTAAFLPHNGGPNPFSSASSMHSYQPSNSHYGGYVVSSNGSAPVAPYAPPFTPPPRSMSHDSYRGGAGWGGAGPPPERSNSSRSGRSGRDPVIEM